MSPLPTPARPHVYAISRASPAVLDAARRGGQDAACLEAKRQHVSAAFFLSIEFQETGFPVYRLTEASFDRMPRYRDFVRDGRTLAEGVFVGTQGWEQRLEANRLAFLEEWTARDEFRAKYDGMSNEQYVDTLYANAGIGREAGRKPRRPPALNMAAVTGQSIMQAPTKFDSLRQNHQPVQPPCVRR